MVDDAEYLARIQEAWRRYRPELAHLYIGRILKERRTAILDEITRTSYEAGLYDDDES